MKDLAQIVNIHIRIDEENLREQRPAGGESFQNLFRDLLAAILYADHRHVDRSLARYIHVQNRKAVAFEPAFDGDGPGQGGDGRAIVPVAGGVNGKDWVLTVGDGSHAAQDSISHLACSIARILTVGSFKPDTVRQYFALDDDLGVRRHQKIIGFTTDQLNRRAS